MYITKKYDYDKKDVQSIYDYASRLVNHTLGGIRNMPMTLSDSPARNAKGKFGQFLEKYYFGIDNNSDSEPDFKEAGLELKSTAIKELKDGRISAKERIVLNIINYETIIHERWESSHLLSKNELIMLIMYLYEEDKCFLDYIVRFVALWKIEGEDKEIIRQDWEYIVKKIRAGKAHELSEGDTFYLGACRKGWKEGLRKQPNSDIKAPQRAFSFKTKYVNSIIKKIEDSENTIKDVSELKEKSFESIIIEKFAPYVDLNVEDIERELGSHLNRKSKSYYAMLARRILGVTAKKIAEFEKADVSMKIIRLKHNGMPKEDMSFPYFRYKEISGQSWEDSDFYYQLEKKFFFVVFQMGKDEKYIRFKKAFFWNMPFDDLKESKKVWLLTKRQIVSGNAEYLPKKSENRVSHVRPHARDSSDTIETCDGKMLVKKCFWLNSGYLKEQIERN